MWENCRENHRRYSLVLRVLLVGTTLAGCTLSDVVRPSTVHFSTDAGHQADPMPVNSLTRRNATDLSEMINPA